MKAVWFRARSDLRHSWRASVGLALLVGLIGGAVLAAAAGARRTDSAFARFLVATKAPDAVVFSSPTDASFAQISAGQLAQLPSVDSVAEGAFFTVLGMSDVGLIAGADGRLGGSMLRHKLLAGRPPRPEAIDEAMVSFTLASTHHVRVGDTLRLPLTAAADDGPPPAEAALRVVGIEASAGEFPPQHGSGTNLAWTTPAFFAAHVKLAKHDDLIAVRVRGRGTADLRAGIEQLSGGTPASIVPIAEEEANTERSIHLQTLALWLLTALLALEGILVVSQLLARQARLGSRDHPALRALGMSRHQLWMVGMARAVLIGGLGAAVAAVLAALLSPLTPVGLAGVAEPRPGFAFDGAVLGLGALATAVVVLAGAAWPSWRTAAADTGARRAGTIGGSRPSALARALAHTAVPLPVTTGVRLALEPGQAGTAVPVRSTITGAVVSVMALAAALTFSANLSHLLATPRLYGVTWDARVANYGESSDINTVLPTVQQDGAISDFSVGYAGFPITLDGVQAEGVAVSPDKGASLEPVALEGRRPSAPDEVMLGSRTMAALGTHLGATVQASVADLTAGTLPLRVVGTAVFPPLGDVIGLGKGAALTPDGLRRMIPNVTQPLDTILVRFQKGVDKPRAMAQLKDRLAASGRFDVVQPERPDDLVNFGRVQRLPLVLGVLLGAFAAATLAHLLVTSIRRRRPDLAVLKVLGLTSAQVRATVAWQATTLAVVAVALGVPFGVVAGRMIWRLFAEQLGTSAEPAVPLLALGALSTAALAVANLVAVLPARSAARTQPAIILRSE